jgi:hypothetical protein
MQYRTLGGRGCSSTACSQPAFVGAQSWRRLAKIGAISVIDKQIDIG